jgi:hypothetical protein
VLQHPDEDKHFMLANLDYAVVGNEKFKFWNVKPLGNMAQNYGEMVYHCMYCAKYNINWQ